MTLIFELEGQDTVSIPMLEYVGYVSKLLRNSLPVKMIEVHLYYNLTFDLEGQGHILCPS